MNKNHRIKALSDEELLNTFLKKRENLYLGELLNRYVRFVFVVCMKYLKEEDEAKDMAMHVFEKINREIHRFEINNFKSWLHVVTKNCCLMHIRDGKKTQKISFENENELANCVENSSVLHHEEYTDKEERFAELEKAIGELEHGQKECIDLFYMKEKSYKEVAKTTGYSLNQVKSHIQNGKRNLKNRLVSNGQFILVLLIYIYFGKI